MVTTDVSGRAELAALLKVTADVVFGVGKLVPSAQRNYEQRSFYYSQ